MSAEMLSDPKKVLPASEMRRLTQGSFEQRIAETTEFVASKYQDDKTKTTVIAVDEVGAVVCLEDVESGDAKFVKLTLERSDKGNLTETGREDIKVDVRDRNDLDDYFEAEALAIVNLWIMGQSDKAKQKLKDLVPQVIGVPEKDESKLVARVESVIAADSPWKAAFLERQEQIESFLGSDLNEDRLRPKFRALYDGTVEEGKVDGFRALVSEDLDTVSTEFDQLASESKAAFEGAIVALAEAQTQESDDTGVLDLFEGFASDLLVDFDRISEQTQIAVDRVTDVRCQGRLRDVLAEGIAPYRAASRFVVKVATLLNQAQEDSNA